MALQSSGQISMGDINVAIGNVATRTNRISLDDTNVRSLLVKPSGQISISDGYGKSLAAAGVFVPGDRAAGRTKSLIITQPDGYGSQVLTGSPGGLARITALEAAAGYTVDHLTTYTDFVNLTDTQLFEYMHIWDLGFYNSLNAATQAQFVKYITQGGAVWWNGENYGGAVFQAKDTSIVNMVTTLGGGTPTVNSFDPGPSGIEAATIEAEFRLANSATSTQFARPSYFDSFGTGTPMCKRVANTAWAPVVVWKTGSLANAPLGCCAAVMDINWVDDTWHDDNFINNLIQVLNKK